MRKTVTFDAFGRKYRSTQFAAVPALRILDKRGELAPHDVLSATEALGYDEAWHPLSSPENINAYVTDGAAVLAPRAILDGIVSEVNALNFGFLKTWKGTKVPKRFRSEGVAVVSEHVDPVVQTLVQDSVASVRELEEYYSLEDAFKMFDILVVKGVNAALSHEQSERDAKTKKR